MPKSVLALVLLAAACAPAPQPAETWVRLQNDTGVRLEKVRVNFLGEIQDYGDIGPGGRTDYRPARIAYRYAWIDAHAAGNPLGAHPVDYMGEAPLGPGRFTYSIRRRDDFESGLSVLASRDP
jgi:hypothetical protein